MSPWKKKYDPKNNTNACQYPDDVTNTCVNSTQHYKQEKNFKSGMDRNGFDVEFQLECSSLIGIALPI